MPDSTRLRSFAEQHYLDLARCVAQRDLGLINRVAIYSFLTQGKIACKNILGARICTAACMNRVYSSLVNQPVFP